MEFSFDEHRVADAVWYVLSNTVVPISHLKLAKLLYLADRRWLLNHGVTITSDRMLACADGPAVASPLDLLDQGEHPMSGCWTEHLRQSARGCQPVAGHGESDYLSESARQTLDEVLAEYGAWSDASLIEFTQTLPEWEAPQGPDSVIDPESILRAEGVPEEDIAEAVALAAAHLKFVRPIGG